MTKAKTNPKQHDHIFKWLLTAFTDDFFAYFFPGTEVGAYEVIDKEFIKKYEALRESLRGDLFLVMEVILEGKVWEIVILIELKSNREDLTARMHEYACYAALLRHRPVWCIALFSDDALWRSRPPSSFPFAYHSERGIVEIPYDIIKLKEHRSAEFIKQRSLLLKLLALKANDDGCRREELIRDIYRAVREQDKALTDEQKILVERFVEYYAALPRKDVNAIKKEVGMTFIASTLTEQLHHEGEERGIKIGQKTGKEIGKEIGIKIGQKTGEKIGRIKGAIINLKDLFEQGLIPVDIYESRLAKLNQEMGRIHPE